MVAARALATVADTSGTIDPLASMARTMADAAAPHHFLFAQNTRTCRERCSASRTRRWNVNGPSGPLGGGAKLWLRFAFDSSTPSLRWSGGRNLSYPANAVTCSLAGMFTLVCSPKRYCGRYHFHTMRAPDRKCGLGTHLPTRSSPLGMTLPEMPHLLLEDGAYAVHHFV